MTPRYQLWRLGYAKQAKSDFGVFKKLEELADLPLCQPLHYLQMACEKLCKAYSCGLKADIDKLQTTHGVIDGTLYTIARQQFARLGGKDARHNRNLRQIRQLAREIELLAPTVDADGRRPDNCEYPWEDDKGLHVPVEYSFPNLNLLRQPAGILLLKLIPAAIDELLIS